MSGQKPHDGVQQRLVRPPGEIRHFPRAHPCRRTVGKMRLRLRALGQFQHFAPARHVACDRTRDHFGETGAQRRHFQHPERQIRRQRAGRQIGRNGEITGLGTGARTEQNRGLRRAECLQRLFADMRQGRNQHQPVAGEVAAGRHDVHIQPQPPDRLVPAQRQFHVAEINALRLDTGDPRRLVVEHQRHRSRPAGGQGAKRGEFARRLRRLPAALAVAAVVGQVEARMHLLLREGGLAPAEI